MQWTTNLIKSCKALERRWFGREAGVAEAERRWVKAEMKPFELSFNRSLKVDFQGSRVTSDGSIGNRAGVGRASGHKAEIPAKVVRGGL